MSSDAMGMRSGGYSGGGYNDGGWRTSRSDHGDNWCKLNGHRLFLFKRQKI